MKKDVFDRMMRLPVLRIFEPFYKKHKEVLMYLFFGGLAFFLNLFLFAFFTETCRINELVSNAISWVICVLFQFFTNRTWVFDGSVDTKADFWKQMASFFGGRVFTLVVVYTLVTGTVKALLRKCYNIITKILRTILDMIVLHLHPVFADVFPIFWGIP